MNYEEHDKEIWRNIRDVMIIAFIVFGSVQFGRYVIPRTPQPITQTKEVKVYIGKEEERCEKMGGRLRYFATKRVGKDLLDIESGYQCLSPEKVLFSSESLQE